MAITKPDEQLENPTRFLCGDCITTFIQKENEDTNFKERSKILILPWVFGT